MTPRDDLKPLYLNTPGLRVGKKDEVLQVKDKDKVIQEIRMSPEMGAAREEAHVLANEAIRELEVLPKTKYRQALTQLAEYVLERKK